LYDDFSVNLTEVYHSPGKHQVENMDQLDYSPFLKEEGYVIAIQAGGPKGEHAILCLYTKYHKEVRIKVSEMISLYPECRVEPQDLVHDAFIVMIHKIQFESFRTGSLKAFWIGIARNIMLNQAKKNGKIFLVQEVQEIYESTEVSPETIFMITERNHQIEEYLSRFGSRCKDILLLWMAHYTMDEIADQLHLSGARMARKVKHLCFKKLKDFILKGNKFAP
jgi:RNA polymerase sigma factor (sigma-70 family)